MDSANIEVIAPNLKRRLSGVTSTIARLVPIQAGQIGIAATGPGLPPHLPHIPIWRLFILPRNRPRVWHARRNTEMLLGVILRSVFRRRILLLFTSASQREHTWFTRWLIFRMDGVIATSKKTKGYLKCPATVVMHGIDLAEFNVAFERSLLTKDLGLPAGKLVGCYGRIRHQKGTDLFVESMIELAPRHPDLYGVIMGRATGKHQEFLAKLKDRISEAGLESRILFRPEVKVDQMARWYQVLDLFVAPQRSEGFGLTPLEAGACGVPTIANRVGAFEELIISDTTGCLVDAGDLQSLTRAIDGAIKNDVWRRAAGKAAFEHISQNFRIESEATALVTIYRDLLRGVGR